MQTEPKWYLIEIFVAARHDSPAVVSALVLDDVRLLCVHSSHERLSLNTRRFNAQTVTRTAAASIDGNAFSIESCSGTPIRACQRLYGYGLSCAFRMYVFTGIHRCFVNRLLSLFGTGKPTHACYRHIHFANVCAVLFTSMMLMLMTMAMMMMNI